MKFILFIVFIVTSLVAQTQELPGYLGSTTRYKFYSNFWVNLHHMVKQEALLRVERDSTIMETGPWEHLSALEKQQMRQVVRYYIENHGDQDLRTSDFMVDFRSWMITQDQIINRVPSQFAGITSSLQSVSEIYRTHYWPEHQVVNDRVLQENIVLLKEIEDDLAKTLRHWTMSYWDSDLIRVDISYYGKATSWNLRDRPYTTLYPTHVVMNSSAQQGVPFGNWLEMMFHESCHHLMSFSSGFVGGTILNVAEVRGVEPPRQLAHAYLFYLSGKAVQQKLVARGYTDYSLYMVRNNVFARYFPVLDTHLPQFMEGNKSLHDVTEAVFEQLGH